MKKTIIALAFAIFSSTHEAQAVSKYVDFVFDSGSTMTFSKPFNIRNGTRKINLTPQETPIYDKWDCELVVDKRNSSRTIPEGTIIGFQGTSRKYIEQGYDNTYTTGKASFKFVKNAYGFKEIQCELSGSEDLYYKEWALMTDKGLEAVLNQNVSVNRVFLKTGFEE
jgi:hypothetical protein